jgi:enoyl-CoA hydratase/carnithine racemase
MGNRELLIDRQEGVAILTLNRPERHNSLSASLLIALAEAFNELTADPDLRSVILRGAGEKAFCAGMDLNSLAESASDDLVSQIGTKGPLQRAVEAIEDCRVPVIAMIRGFALGAGLELALGCDLRVGSEESRLGMPPVRLGIVYAPEGLSRFIRSVGLAQSKKLFLTGRYVGGVEAYEMGLLHYVIKDPELETFTRELAQEIAGRAPLAVAGIKKSLNILSSQAEPSEEDKALMDELLKKATGSRDMLEALAAFSEKRAPHFEGR